MGVDAVCQRAKDWALIDGDNHCSRCGVLTVHFLWFRYDWMSSAWRILYKRPSCHTLLKDFSTSRNTAAVGVVVYMFRNSQSLTNLPSLGRYFSVWFVIRFIPGAFFLSRLGIMFATSSAEASSGWWFVLFLYIRLKISLLSWRFTNWQCVCLVQKYFLDSLQIPPCFLCSQISAFG